jgi:hypothetical protein
MKNFQLDSKIVWRRNSAEDISEVFYPSFYKDINKKELFFNNNFNIEFVGADTDKLKELFLPLYLDEIANRKDFSLDKRTIGDELAQKITANSYYKFMFIYHHGEVVATALFSIKNDGLYVGYRAWKKDLGKALSHKATVSYWGEKLIFNYGKELGVKFFSYGKDSNPYVGHSKIGLPLYKIKTGMRPKKPESTTPFSTDSYSEAIFTEKGEPAIFFTNSNDHGFYSECYLYFPAGSLSESYLKEFEKVLSWAGLIFNPVSY